MRVLKTIMLATAVFLGACAATATHRSTGQVIDDASITTQVKASFAKDPLVDAIDINVDTHKGQVQLSGFADSQAQVNQAVALARQTNGVVGVENNLRVK